MSAISATSPLEYVRTYLFRIASLQEPWATQRMKMGHWAGVRFIISISQDLPGVQSMELEVSQTSVRWWENHLRWKECVGINCIARLEWRRDKIYPQITYVAISGSRAPSTPKSSGQSNTIPWAGHLKGHNGKIPRLTVTKQAIEEILRKYMRWASDPRNESVPFSPCNKSRVNGDSNEFVDNLISPKRKKQE